jgi:hypothetical protein
MDADDAPKVFDPPVRHSHGAGPPPARRVLRAQRGGQAARSAGPDQRRARDPYPPGIPVVAPGELITQPIVDYLQEIVAAGAFLEGAADQSLDSFRVIAR